MRQGETGGEGVEAARLPGPEEGGEGHARVGPRVATGAATDLADDDERARPGKRQNSEYNLSDREILREK